MRSITGIVVHCTATRPEWWADKTSQQKMEECRRWHVDDNGWADIGYHYLIDRDGTVTEGRPMEKDGAHARGHNKGTVGISLWGGHGSNEKDQFEDNFTADQGRALRKLIAKLKEAHGSLDIIGHNQVAAKACPGFHVPSWLAHKPKSERSHPAKTSTVQASTVTGAVSVGTGVLAAMSSMDPVVQYILTGGAVVALLASIWIFKERIKKFAAGDR